MAHRDQRDQKKKFTTSDAIALGTTLVSTVGSFSKGLKYNPNADKPKLFTPIVRPSVGDPNLDRYLRDIDQKTASTNRLIRERTGSDTNAGVLAILEANKNREESKSRVYAKHADLIEEQERERVGIINRAEEFNITGTNRFLERVQDRDVTDARRVREAARESIESGFQYISDRDVHFKDALIKQDLANSRIDIISEKHKQNFIANQTPYLGYQGAVDAYKNREDPFDFDSLKSYTYGNAPEKPHTFRVPGTAPTQTSTNQTSTNQSSTAIKVFEKIRKYFGGSGYEGLQELEKEFKNG